MDGKGKLMFDYNTQLMVLEPIKREDGRYYIPIGFGNEIYMRISTDHFEGDTHEEKLTEAHIFAQSVVERYNSSFLADRSDDSWEDESWSEDSWDD